MLSRCGTLQISSVRYGMLAPGWTERGDAVGELSTRPFAIAGGMELYPCLNGSVAPAYGVLAFLALLRFWYAGLSLYISQVGESVSATCHTRA